MGIIAARALARAVRAVVPSSSPLYSRLPFREAGEDGPLLAQDPSHGESYELEEKAVKPGQRAARVLPFRRIWTKNVLCTLLAQAFFDFQMGYEPGRVVI